MYATYYVAQRPTVQFLHRPTVDFFNLLRSNLHHARRQSGTTKPTTCSAPLPSEDTHRASTEQAPNAAAATSTEENKEPTTATRATTPRPERVVRPHVRTEESKDAYLVFADLPGVQRDAISIAIEDRELRIEATRELGNENTPLVRYRQVFTLPEHVASDAVEARYDNGVLHLVVPKPKQPQAVRIAVG